MHLVPVLIPRRWPGAPAIGSATSTGTVEVVYGTSRWPVREDIAAAHAAWLDHLARPGTWWSSAQRLAFVAAVWSALDDPAPRPPWDPPPPPADWPLPTAAYGLAHRLACHAATTSEAWYRATLRGMSRPEGPDDTLTPGHGDPAGAGAADPIRGPADRRPFSGRDGPAASPDRANRHGPARASGAGGPPVPDGRAAPPNPVAPADSVASTDRGDVVSRSEADDPAPHDPSGPAHEAAPTSAAGPDTPAGPDVPLRATGPSGAATGVQPVSPAPKDLGEAGAGNKGSKGSKGNKAAEPDEFGEPDDPPDPHPMAPAFVELVSLAALGCAVATFGPALGVRRPPLPDPRPGRPARTTPLLVSAEMNWVPVTPPADERPAVVQAFTAVPPEDDMLWRLAAAQYMPLEAMVHLDWHRPGSPLQRRQVELVAARLSIRRGCFY
jgi:hypothetical protein